MRERTGGQTAAGTISMAFGMMGVVMSALLLAFGPSLEADMAGGSATAGAFIMKVPTSDAMSLSLELAMVTAWIGLIIAGAGVLRLKPWSWHASVLCGAALGVTSAAKMLDGGFSFSALGFMLFGAALAGVFLCSDWRHVLLTEAEPGLDIEHILLQDEAAEANARRAA